MRGSLVPRNTRGPLRRNIRRLSNGRCLNNDRTAGMLGDLRVDKLAEMRTQARVGSFLVSGFLFGVGGGWNQDEMEDHGTVYATRFMRVRESIEAMKEIWTKETAEYHGEFVNFDPGDELEHFYRKSQQLGSAHSIFSKTQEARRQSHRQSRPRPKSSSQRTPRWRGVDSNFRFREGSLEKPLSLFSGGRKVRIPLSADMILLWHPPTYRRSAHYRSHRL